MKLISVLKYWPEIKSQWINIGSHLPPFSPLPFPALMLLINHSTLYAGTKDRPVPSRPFGTQNLGYRDSPRDWDWAIDGFAK